MEIGIVVRYLTRFLEKRKYSKDATSDDVDNEVDKLMSYSLSLDE